VSIKIVRFPPRSIAAIFVCQERDGDGWVALGSHGAWLSGSLADALDEARWLAANLALPIRETSYVRAA
jgi:hypothetical protein